MVKEERIGLHQHGVKKMSIDYSLDIEEICHYATANNMNKVGFIGDFPIYSFPVIDSITERFRLCPIYGIEAYIDGETLHYSFEFQRYQKKPHITVVAKNAKGLDNLYKIMNGKKVSIDVMNDTENGLMFGTGLAFSELYYAILNNLSLSEIKRLLSRYDFIEVIAPYYYYEGLFFPTARRKLDKRVFLEEKELFKLIEKIIEIADECDVPIIGLKGESLTSTDELLREYSELITEEKAYEICVTNTHRLFDEIEPIDVIPKNKFYPVNEEEMDSRLRDICKSRLHDVYSENIEKKVIERFEWELDALKNTNSGFQLIVIHDVMKKMKLTSYDISIRGVWANSFVAFLMGLTDFNPIEYSLSPFFVFMPNKDKEIDVDINVPQNIRDEFLHEITTLDYINGQCIHAARLCVNKKATLEDIAQNTGIFIHPGGVFFIPNDICPYIPACNEYNIPMALFDYRYMDKSFFMIHIYGEENLSVLRELSDITGTPLSSIDLHDPKLYEIFIEDRNVISNLMRKIPQFNDDEMLDVILDVRPQTFYDLVKVVGLKQSDGAWYNNGKDLIKESKINLSDVISTREDVYEYLCSCGIEEDIAFYIAEECRKGKISTGKSIMYNKYEPVLAEKVPQWYINSLEKIRYLFPKAFCINMCEIALRMLYFKIYHTEAFIHVFDQLEYGEDIIYV